MAWEQSSLSLPSQPGVYWFIDDANKVLYVGKAKDLKKRIASYRRFKQLTTRKQQMVLEATQLKHLVLKSELEALLIEAELIRVHQPQYNVLLKDDKSPLYLIISDSAYPSVQMVRRAEIYKTQIKGKVLGPFRSAYKLKQVLHIARKIFPWCDKAQTRIEDNVNEEELIDQLQQNRQACFYYHLDQCPGACLGLINPDEYQQNINQLIKFLKGQKKQVVKELEQARKRAADELKFEKAQQLKLKIQLIQEVTSSRYRLKPDLILPALQQNQTKNALLNLKKILTDYLPLPKNYQLERIEGYDVSNIQGKDAAVSMVVFSNGEPDKSNYRLFNIYSLDTPNDYQMLKEAISRRQNHPEWGEPNLLLIDGGKGQVRAALSVWQGQAPVVGLAKNPDRLVIPVNHYLEEKTGRLKIEYQVLKLPQDHPALKLAQRVRDESHRFAKKQHTRLRNRHLLE